jgi:hypothetical protein
MNIIPALIVMKKRLNIHLRFGRKINLIPKLFFVVRATKK